MIALFKKTRPLHRVFSYTTFHKAISLKRLRGMSATFHKHLTDYLLTKKPRMQVF